MDGAPFASAGQEWRARGAPIPSADDPGRAEQTRPLASRSFVQWRAPPGRQGPRPLHDVWVDGRRDGSWGEWWSEAGAKDPPLKLQHRHDTYDADVAHLLHTGDTGFPSIKV